MPKVIVNVAMSIDGKIALPDGRRLKISDSEDMRRVHMLRNSSDAVLVGIGTVLKDNPKLMVKEEYVKKPKQPLRVVLDAKGRIPKNARILRGGAKTLIATTSGVRIPGVECIECGTGELVDLHILMKKLDELGIKSLMVEGGSTVIWSFLREGLVDEMNVFVGSMVIGGHGPTLAGGEGARGIEDIIRMSLIDVQPLGSGVLLRYKP